MTLANTIVSDALAVFTSTDDFAELVTYVPTRFGIDPQRDPRQIKAVVIREPMAVVSEDGDTVVPVFQVHVANSSTEGISSTELDLGGDQIQMPTRDGKSAESRTITQLLIQDTGMLVLECR